MNNYESLGNMMNSHINFRNKVINSKGYKVFSVPKMGLSKLWNGFKKLPKIKADITSGYLMQEDIKKVYENIGKELDEKILDAEQEKKLAIDSGDKFAAAMIELSITDLTNKRNVNDRFVSGEKRNHSVFTIKNTVLRIFKKRKNLKNILKNLELDDLRKKLNNMSERELDELLEKYGENKLNNIQNNINEELDEKREELKSLFKGTPYEEFLSELDNMSIKELLEVEFNYKQSLIDKRNIENVKKSELIAKLSKDLPKTKFAPLLSNIKKLSLDEINAISNLVDKELSMTFSKKMSFNSNVSPSPSYEQNVVEGYDRGFTPEPKEHVNYEEIVNDGYGYTPQPKKDVNYESIANEGYGKGYELNVSTSSGDIKTNEEDITSSYHRQVIDNSNVVKEPEFDGNYHYQQIDNSKVVKEPEFDGNYHYQQINGENPVISTEEEAMESYLRR